MAAVRQTSTVKLQLWATLLAKRGYQLSADNRLVKVAAAGTGNQSKSSPQRPPSPAGGSIIDKFRRANAFAAPVAPPRDNGVQPNQPFAPHRLDTQTRENSGIIVSEAFKGIKFCLLGEAKTKLALLSFSSGTTGRPKVLPHSSF